MRYQNPGLSQTLHTVLETKHYFLLRNSFLLYINTILLKLNRKGEPETITGSEACRTRYDVPRVIKGPLGCLVSLVLELCLTYGSHNENS